MEDWVFTTWRSPVVVVAKQKLKEIFLLAEEQLLRN